MKITATIVIFMGSMMLTRADQLVESVQQALKDEGFYYGEVNGDMNANVTAAIRRYQIRNGLQVTGELNDETLRSLRIKSSGPSGRLTNAPSPTPPTSPVASEPPSDEAQTASPAPPVQPFNNAPPGQQVFPSSPVGPATSPASVFADTPFQNAPPGVQRNVIVSVQIVLARYGLYREQIDGIYGPAMELSIRAYQAQARLPVTGRLDVATLSALRLLPGPRRQFYNPRRMWPPPGPPVRGQWEPD